MKADILREKMQQRKMTVDDLADALHLDRVTIYRKLQRPEKSFSVEEASGIIKALRLSKKDANYIFFDQ